MNRLYHLIIHDGLRKIIALVLAVMLYFGISLRITQERTISNVPVKVTLASGLVGDVSDVTTNVTVKGFDKNIDIAPGDLTAEVTVDHNNLVSGRTYIAEPSVISSKSGVVVKKCDKVTLHLQKVVSRQLPVEVKYDGKPNANFTVTGTAVIPEEVTVIGAEDVVNSMRVVVTSKVPLEDAAASFEYKSAVSVMDDIKVEPASVLVQTQISRKFEPRAVKGVPVMLLSGAAGNGYSVELANGKVAVDIVVSGSPSAIAAIKNDSIKAFVDASKVRSESTRVLPVECSSSVEGVVVRSVTPGTVAVKVTRLKK